MTIDICLSPALFPFYQVSTSTVIVVVDVFRASSTICAALKAGASSIIPVSSIDEALLYKSKGFMVGAERNVSRCDFADFGNSPFEYLEEIISSREIVFTTTNGTKALNLAQDAHSVMIGALVNLNSIASYCAKMNLDVLVLCAGWNNQVNIEDTLFGGALVEKLQQTGVYELKGDASVLALSLWKDAKGDLKSYMKCSEHYHRLMRNGLERDIDYCLALNSTDILPIYDRSSNKISNLNQ
jgi:2-phosphosulfolactate phosphatase